MNKISTAIVLASATSAYALPLDLGGGSGAPATFGLDGKVDYTVTRAYSNVELVFVFPAIGLTNFVNGTVQTTSNSLYFTINDDPYQYDLTNTASTRFENLTAINFSSVDAVTVSTGDVVTLWGGSATTVSSIFATVPTELNYDTYLMPRGQPFPVATTGTYSTVPIPEPSAFAALAGAGVLVLAATRRRRRA